MQPDQALLEVLERLEARDFESLLLSPDDISEWPDGTADLMLELGLIKNASPAKVTQCHGCEENCLMPVHVLPPSQNRPARFFVSCDKREDVGRIPADPADLSRFQIDVDQTIRLLARAFGSRQLHRELREGRVYHIGNHVLAGKRRGIFIMRGATWLDGAELLGGLVLELEAFPSPLILVPCELPPPGDRMHYTFASMAHITCIANGGLTLDQAELVNRISKGQRQQDQTVVPFTVAPGTRWEELTISFVNEETVKIVVRGSIEHRTFREMGFMDARKREETADRLWSALLWLAQNHGEIDWTDSRGKVNDTGSIKKRISKIRERLKAVFPDIAGDPFHSY